MLKRVPPRVVDGLREEVWWWTGQGETGGDVRLKFRLEDLEESRSQRGGGCVGFVSF